MIARLAKNISSFFVTNNIIKSEDKEVYDYSLEIMLSTILNGLVVLLIAILTRSFLLSIVYLVGFLPLRGMAGGYHAKTHFRCMLVLLFTYSAFLLVIKFIPQNAVVYSLAVSVLLSFLLIFILAPVEDKNKPLSEKEVKKLKKKSRVAVAVYTVAIVVIFLLLPNKLYALALSLGVLSVALSLFASVIKNKITK